jgi:hypothetical protein
MAAPTPIGSGLKEATNDTYLITPRKSSVGVHLHAINFARANEQGKFHRKQFMSFSYEELRHLSRGIVGVTDTTCPVCSHNRKRANQGRKVFRIWNEGNGFITFKCQHCGASGWSSNESGKDNVIPFDRAELAQRKAEAEKRQRANEAERLEKASWLYAQRQPLANTIAESYLRKTRAYSGPLPATLGFLPARGEHAPAIIAPFGFPEEPEPGELVMSKDAVRGVQLIGLLPDGNGKSGPPITVGRCQGYPIVLAPVNDGGGLVIAEGLEKSLHAGYAFGGCRDDGQIGVGVWASGGKGRLPALVDMMPTYVEAVTIFADHDEDGGAQRNAEELERRLHDRGIEALAIPGSEWQRVAR